MRTRPLSARYLRQVQALKNIQANRPGSVRNTITMFLYSIVCFFAGNLFLIWGVCILFDTRVGRKLMAMFLHLPNPDTATTLPLARVQNFTAICFLVAGFLCLTISKLARNLMKSNRYIRELESAVHNI